MNKLSEQLQNELDNMYHNATIRQGKLTTESDYETDLVQEFINDECSRAINDIKYSFPAILKYGEVYAWGRSGATLAPESLIDQKGGGSFRIKKAEDLELTVSQKRHLLKTLVKFNKLVRSFCSEVSDDMIMHVRECYGEEIAENKDKKRQYQSGYIYV